MLFNVQSGKHSLDVEALNFDQAAETFLKTILDTENPLVGDIIKVSIPVNESYFFTADAIKKIDNKRSMSLVH